MGGSPGCSTLRVWQAYSCRIALIVPLGKAVEDALDLLGRLELEVDEEIVTRSKVGYYRSMRNGWSGMRFVLSLMLFVAAMWMLTSHPAQAGSGVYLSSELGANFSPDLDTTGTSNDRASACDEFINPMFATVTQTAGYETYNCTGPHRGATGDWKNSFDGCRGHSGRHGGGI